jgi:hypothetical protein
MGTIIAYPGHNPLVIDELRVAARQRAERLAKATAEQLQDALAYLSVIDPDAFEIAFSAVPAPADAHDDEEPEPLCRICGAPVGIFREHDLGWVHYRGDSAAAGTHEIHDPGHPADPAWFLLDEAAEEF